MAQPHIQYARLEGENVILRPVSVEDAPLAYRFVANAPALLGDVWLGALLASLAIETLKYGYGVYVVNFSSYGAAYGALGGFLLFMHQHGPHPAAPQIMIHHTIMGMLAITAGSCRLVDEYAEVRKGQKANREGRSNLKVLWAILVTLIGVQLLFYSES